MYSLVLMAAMTSAPDATAFGRRAGCTGCCGVVVASCQGCSGSCYGSCTGSCYGTYAPMAYATSCYGSCYGTSYQVGCHGCYSSCLGSTCYGWSIGGSACFGGAAGCYSLYSPVGGGYGYNIWLDPNNGPTILPPRVGYLFHGGSFHGRLYHPYSGHHAQYNGGGYYDDCCGQTVPQWAGGNGVGYMQFQSAGGFDPSVVDAVYAPRAEAKAGSGGVPQQMDAPKPKQVQAAPAKADVAVELPADAVLTVDGKTVDGKGESRRFHTPELAVGQAFYYEMTATVTADGQPVTEKATAVVRAGETTTVRFAKLFAAAQPAGASVAKK